EHARRGNAVPLDGRRRRRQPLESEDERHRRDEVGDRDELADRHQAFRGFEGACPLGFCLNIASIRSVTTKPPTTFAVPRTTARNPSTTPSGPGIALATSIAPTMTMPWIAFAPDMSGVCRVEGTFEMTSNPTKIARMKTEAATTASAVMRTSRGRGAEAP